MAKKAKKSVKSAKSAEDKKTKIKNLLKARIPSLFEREPRGSISDGSLQSLVEDLLKLK